MIGHAGVLIRTFRSGVILLVLGKDADVDERAADGFARLAHGAVFGRVGPEAAAHDHGGLRVDLERLQEVGDALLVFGLGFRGLQRGDVLADAEDDEVGFEGGGIGELSDDIITDVVTFKVGDVLDHDFRLSPLFDRERPGHEVDIVLVRRGRGHAPVAVPIDVGLRAVLRDAIADEEYLLGLRLRGSGRGAAEHGDQGSQ